MTYDTHTPGRVRQGIVMHACPLVRRGLLCFLTAQLPDFRFQAAHSFSHLGRLPGLTAVDLVVSDISDEEHPAAYGADWLVWLQHLRGDWPLVVITEELPTAQWLALSRQPGVSALALHTPQAELVPQLQQILAGKPVISLRLLPASPPPALAPLTGAELQVFALLHAGYSVTQIAVHLHRSVKTVSTHKRHLMEKLGVDNEIALFARVKTLNETTCGLDNGQQFVKYRPPGAP